MKVKPVLLAKCWCHPNGLTVHHIDSKYNQILYASCQIRPQYSITEITFFKTKQQNSAGCKKFLVNPEF